MQYSRSLPHVQNQMQGLAQAGQAQHNAAFSLPLTVTCTLHFAGIKRCRSQLACHEHMYVHLSQTCYPDKQA